MRYGIPLLIVVFTAVLAAYTVQKEWDAAEAVVRGEGVSQMITRITLLREQLVYAYATGHHERIAEEMRLLASAPEPQIAMLADDTAIVLGATNSEWVGRSLGDAVRAEWPRWQGEPLQVIVDRVRAESSGELFLAAAGRYVLGVYPVKLGVAAPERVGVLIVQRDLSRKLAHARRTVEQHRGEMVAVLAGLAVILGILIHFFVTRRVSALLNATQEFAAGKLEARTDLRGTDEVANL
ncbi:MAG: hypothetical protein ACREXX_22185, partial [Gammaproteobacteria bacterium]